MRWYKISILLITAVIVLAAGFLAYLTITNAKYEAAEQMSVTNNQVAEIPILVEMRITTLNIGYGGLGRNQDLFSEGGKGSGAETKDEVIRNLESAVLGLDASESEVFLLQEVDTDSERSKGIDQSDYFSISYPHFGNVYSINHDSVYIPFPVIKPVGRVKSGLMTMSRYNASKARRHSLYNGISWPANLFSMDMCFLETRHPVSNGRELIIVNLQLSPFDDKRITRERQLMELRNFINDEYSKGNYIIVGGDWNHNLPGTDPYYFSSREPWPSWLKTIPDSENTQGFEWVADLDTPTLRSLSSPYKKDYSFLTVVDGFLVSDNVEIVDIKSMDEGFEYSHHNPVTMTFVLQ
jgi:endonuclease/exonuclease/phosphatase family metal-dependent hydrolase